MDSPFTFFFVCVYFALTQFNTSFESPHLLCVYLSCLHSFILFSFSPFFSLRSLPVLSSSSFYLVSRRFTPSHTLSPTSSICTFTRLFCSSSHVSLMLSIVCSSLSLSSLLIPMQTCTLAQLVSRRRLSLSSSVGQFTLFLFNP